MFTRISKFALVLLTLGMNVATAMAQGVGNSSQASQAQSDKQLSMTDSGRPNWTPFSRFTKGFSSFDAVMQVEASYDDNVLSDDAHPLSDVVARVTLMTGAHRRWRRTSWDIRYVPEFNEYTRNDSLSFISHAFNQNVTHNLSAHTSLSWDANFSRYESRAGAPSVAVDFGTVNLLLPNLQALSGNQRFTVTSASTSLSWDKQFSARDDVGVSVGAGLSRFQQESGAPVAYIQPNTQSYNVTLNYRRKLAAHTSVGIVGSALYLRQTSPKGHENDQTLGLTLQQELGRGWVFSAGGGPMFRHATSGVIGATGNSYFGRAELSRNMKRSSFSVGYARSLQLGIANSSFLLDQITGAFFHSFTRRLYTNSALSYSTNPSSTYGTDTFGAGIQLGYRLTPRWIAFTNYARGQQEANGQLSGLTFHRNQFGFGIAVNLGSGPRGDY